MLTILWHDKESKGYTDHIPFSWVTKDGIFEGMHHVLGPDWSSYQARCRVAVFRDTVDLDYGAFPDFNGSKGMFLGVLRLQFRTAERMEVLKVFWRDQGKDGFQECDVTVMTPWNYLPRREQEHSYSPSPARCNLQQGSSGLP